MKPFIRETIRIPLLIIIRSIIWGDYLFRKLSRIAVPYPFKREGSCLQCGRCCLEIAFELNPHYFRFSWLIKSIKIYQSFFNHLDFINSYPKEGYLTFKCRDLTAKGECGNYYWRPVFCREYPRPYKYFEKPTTLPWCGFSFKNKYK